MAKTTRENPLARETLRLYWREASPMKWHLILSYIFSGLYVFANDICVPLFMGGLVDALIQEPRDTSRIYNLLILLIVVYMLGTMVFARLTFYLRNKLIASTEKRLNMLVFDAYERQEYSFYTNNFVGSLVAKAQRFVSTYKDLYDASAFQLLNLLVQLVASVAILSFKAPPLAVLFVVVAFIASMVILFTNKIRIPLLRKNSAMGSEVTAALADVLTNNLAVKVFASRKHEQQRFSGVADKRKQAHYTAMVKTEIIRVLRSLVASGFQVFGAITLVVLALRGSISVGTILVAQLYLVRLEDSLWNLSRLSEKLEESLADAAEMTEIILRKPLVNDVVSPAPFTLKVGDIHFRDINFQYDDSQEGQVLFKDLDLHISSGQKIGLVGPSGGGKTTFTKLLLRFMDINNGSILVDGQDISTVAQDDLRHAIAYVPQEPLLFHRSIKENIAYGNPDANDKQIMEAAQLAHAKDFIEALPQGYETLVGERGVKLSGGEKQRIAIARAMLKKAPIVILDEATSALDSKSEKAIVGALDNLMKNRTTIVIAHRLSTIRKLNRIVVLKKGQIVEDGSHEQLLKHKNGVYAELWHHQSGEFLPEE